MLDRGRPAPDVIVIGGGIVGVAAATHLAEDGRRVLLLERTEIAAGASGRNSGVVQHPFDPVLVELHLETVDLYRALDGFGIGRVPAGLLSVTHDVDVVRRIAVELAATHPSMQPMFVSPEEMRRIEPAVAHDVAACRLEIGYPVAPASATRAYAERAERAGVDIRVGVAARRLAERRPGARRDARRRRDASPRTTWSWRPGRGRRRSSTRAARGDRSCRVGASSSRWPSTPRRRHVLEEAEISIEPGSADDGEAGHSFSLVTADGSSSLGSTFLADEPEPVALVPALVRRGARFVPAIADASIGPPRLCARPQSLDGRPLVGAVPGLAGLWVAAGHGPWGISTGPASGRLIADLVAGRLSASPSPLDPARFGAPA